MTDKRPMAGVVSRVIAESVSGVHRIDGEFVRIDAVVVEGVITVTAHRYDFEGDDDTVQLFISSPVPVHVVEAAPEQEPVEEHDPLIGDAA